MSSNKKDDSVVPDGRDKTDKSLSAERAKTDRSLASAKENLEIRADKAVSASREEADETRSQIRRDGDRSRDSSSSSPSSEASDARLQNERQKFDKALNIERKQVDDALEQERTEKQSVENTLLRKERTETDKDLTFERTWTDNQYLQAANVLSEEIKAHLATRTSLTSRKELLAIVSHDLKNPLSSISLATELVRTAAHAGDMAEVQEYMELIERNAEEALRLIGDILDMERMAAGKVILTVEPHDFRETVQYAYKTIEHQSVGKQISLETHYCSDANSIVLCDQDRVSQVLSNLTSNALKFTPVGGKVSIAVHCTADEVRVSVSDTGPGIPTEMHEKIFERFSQIDQMNRLGLGLGLYISKMIIEAHRGRIWVESTLGRGSTFHFTLPTREKLA